MGPLMPAFDEARRGFVYTNHESREVSTSTLREIVSIEGGKRGEKHEVDPASEEGEENDE